MKTTLRFQPGGGLVQCLYTEAINLLTIGPLQITRATDLCFNQTSQQWEVHDAESDRILYSNTSRTECLAWEHRNLQPGSSVNVTPNLLSTSK